MSVCFADLPKRWRCVVPPAAEPLHRTEAKAQSGLLVDQTDWDADFDRWISAARDYLEDIAELALLTQTWELTLPRFPSGSGPMELFRPPVQAIEWIRYRDTAGELQTLPVDQYRTALELYPAVLVPAIYDCWPATDCSPAAVVIRFRTGFATPAAANATSNVITPTPQHFVDGDELRASNSGGTLPTGLSLRTTYFVRDADAAGLKLAATEDGAAIDLTSAGTGQLLIGGDVPAKAIQALRLQVAHWFRNRESVLTGTISKTVEHAFEALAMSLRWR